MKVLAWASVDEKGRYAEFPKIGKYSQWIVDTLQGIGFSANGEVISFSELFSWGRFSGVHFSAWEAETLKYLSGVFISSSRTYADGKDLPPPYESEESKISRLEKADRIARESWT